MFRNRIFIVSLCLVVAGCATPQMRVDSTLEAAGKVYAVHGHQGWLVDQQLRFGRFLAGPVTRGWTKGYGYPFIVRFAEAREKLRFAVPAEGRAEATSHCIGMLREQDLHAFLEYFDVNPNTADTFACSVGVDGGAAPVELRSVWHLASGQCSLGTEPLGYEFLRAGEAIGAGDTVNEGRVWLRGNLAPEERLVIATAASALLLRKGLAQHNLGL
jgi:hypothetical protein